MNVADSRRMLAHFELRGYRESSQLALSDVILLNTCSIREKAEQKVLSLLGELRGVKQNNPHCVLGVTGCVGQRMGRVLLEKVPHLDLVVGPDQVDVIYEMVEEVKQGGRRRVASELTADKSRTYVQPILGGTGRPSEYVTIMKGCDHFCTYCIVPFVRGREQSRRIADILEEVHRRVLQGAKEIIFLGQNINTYGKGTSESLAQLLVEASQVEGLLRVRYLTSHPYDLGLDLMCQFGSVPKLMPQLHLPAQSGSNAVLKAMGRIYSREQYLEKVATLRSYCPGIALSTDMIVGFPGETDHDFAQSLSLMEEVGFGSAYLFKYSVRPGTKAAKLVSSDTTLSEIPERVKSDRLKEIQGVAERHIERQNQALVGTTQEVLLERPDKRQGHLCGRTPHFKMVHVPQVSQDLSGHVVPVTITHATAVALYGRLAPRTSAPGEPLRPEAPCAPQVNTTWVH